MKSLPVWFWNSFVCHFFAILVSDSEWKFRQQKQNRSIPSRAPACSTCAILLRQLCENLLKQNFKKGFLKLHIIQHYLKLFYNSKTIKEPKIIWSKIIETLHKFCQKIALYYILLKELDLLYASSYALLVFSSALVSSGIGFLLKLGLATK